MLLLDKEEVKEYYSNHTRKMTAKHFKVTENQLRTFLKNNKIQRSTPGFSNPETNRNRLKELEKFWTNKDRTREAKRKAQKTMNDRYNDKNYNLTQSNKVIKEKYGVDNYMLSNDFISKSINTIEKRYGVKIEWGAIQKIQEIHKKTIHTMQDRYGVDNPLSKGSSFRLKRDKTMINKYGSIIPLNNYKIKEKYNDTLLRKYNVTNPGLINKNNYISKEEIRLIPFLDRLGFIHNDLHSQKQFFVTFSDGRKKYPDFYSLENHIILEYNGSYWHQDQKQPIYWKEEWEKLGFKSLIIWDFELEDFINNNINSLSILIDRYPSTYRTK